jgi:acyl carrier protein
MTATKPDSAGNLDVLELFRRSYEEVKGAPPPREIGRDTPVSALGVDSIGLMQIVGILEDELGVVLGDEDIPRLRTVGDIEDLILRKRDAVSPS